MWDTSCPDWQERLMAGKSLVPDLPLFKGEADKAVRIFDRLKLPDVIGMPAMREAAGDWFRDIVRALFGSLDTSTNRRMIQELFLLVPKKNGKSSYAAAIMVVAMIMNRRPNAEFLLIAPTKEIAGIAFKQAEGIIKADPELRKKFHPQKHVKTINHLETGATLQIKAADTDVITGSKSTGILVDETHEFAKKSSASEIFVEIRGALAARPDGFMIQITTQSKDAPAGVFKSELHIARQVRDGEIKLPRLAVLYELPLAIAQNDGWKDEKTWPLVNPNMGKSVDKEFLRNQLVTAEIGGEKETTLLASQHFNVQVGLALKNDAWAGARYWLGAKDPQQITLESLIERSEVIVVGGDGGGLDDLLALSFLGRDKISKDWLCWVHAWAQDDVLKNRKEIAERLQDFVKDGDLTISQDAKQDVKEFCDMIKLVFDTGLIPAENGIGLDPASITTIVDELAARGIHTAENGGPIVGAKQSALALSPSIWGLERKLKDATFWHAGQPMMAWCVSNAKAEQRGNAVLITKQTAGKAKIDPLVATFNAVMLMSRNPEAVGTSVYETRGVILS